MGKKIVKESPNKRDGKPFFQPPVHHGEVRRNFKFTKAELAERLIENILAKSENDAIAKPIVLHHLKQLKAELGKLKKMQITLDSKSAVFDCMQIIDKKIAKINK